MARDVFIGVDGIARRVKAIYYGVGGVAHRVIDGYVGVNGVARSFLAKFTAKFWSAIAGNEGTVIHNVFTGRQEGNWRLYMEAQCNNNTETARAYARVRVYNYDFVAGSSLDMTYTASGSGAYADILLIFMTASGGVISKHLLSDGEQKTFSTTIPTDTKYIDFSLQYGRVGMAAMELLIHSLTIGGETFV